MQDKNSISNTFKVAAILCLVCSLVVSATAVGLKGLQAKNVLLDKQKNILTVSGFTAEQVSKMKPSEIQGIFEGKNDRIEIEDVIVDLETGKQVGLDTLAEYGITAKSIADFDQEKTTSQKSQRTSISGDVSIGLKNRELFSHVYIVRDKKKNKINRYVFPVKGKGLWSTLMGYLAVDASIEKIEGLTFYSHKETPGLGGEVDNPKWKKLWEGRMIYTESGEIPSAFVVKGSPDPENRNAVAGLSGATITSKGVSNLVRYWLSEEGFGNFINQVKK